MGRQELLTEHRCCYIIIVLLRIAEGRLDEGRCGLGESGS